MNRLHAVRTGVPGQRDLPKTDVRDRKTSSSHRRNVEAWPVLTERKIAPRRQGLGRQGGQAAVAASAEQRWRNAERMANLYTQAGDVPALSKLVQADARRSKDSTRSRGSSCLRAREPCTSTRRRIASEVTDDIHAAASGDSGLEMLLHRERVQDARVQ